LEEFRVYVTVLMEGFGELKFIYLMGWHITRAINHLYPLEITSKFKEVKTCEDFIQRTGYIKETNKTSNQTNCHYCKTMGKSTLKRKRLGCFVYNNLIYFYHSIFLSLPSVMEHELI